MKRGLTVAVLIVLAGSLWGIWRHFFRPSTLPPQPRTVADVVRALSHPVETRLRPVFAAAGVPYPPPDFTLVALKAERRLELYAGEPARRVCAWPILGASGTAGPKLREGDQQVPEGFYRLELLNPNSRFHLSLRVNYPSPDDHARAAEDGRDGEDLGGDIMIHGGTSSIGCLAMGDPAVEELFVLAAQTGLDDISFLIAPWDFRHSPPEALPEASPVWLDERYRQLAERLNHYPVERP